MVKMMEKVYFRSYKKLLICTGMQGARQCCNSMMLDKLKLLVTAVIVNMN